MFMVYMKGQAKSASNMKFITQNKK